MHAPHRNEDFPLYINIARDRAEGRLARRPPERGAVDRRLIVGAVKRAVDEAIGRHADQASATEAVREALGPDHLIPYGVFLKANGISYDLGQKLRDTGQLKVLRVGGKLMVRKGHTAEFIRNLPLDK